MIARLALLSMFSFTSIAYSQETIVVPSEGSTMLLGSGYDSVSGLVKDRCVVGSAVTETIGGNGGTTLLTHEEISSRREYRQSMQLGASGSFTYGGFTGSAKTSILNSYDFNSHTYVMIARIEVANQSQVLSSYTLVPEAKKLLADNPQKFHQICGDSFIAARVTGGEFAALIRLETTSSAELQELSGSFKANYLSMSGSAEASRIVSEAFADHRGSIRIIRRGGTEALPEFWNPLAVREYTRNFPSEVSGDSSRPITYSVSTVRYEDMLDAVSLEPITVTSSRRVMAEFAEYYDQALDLHDDLKFVLSNPLQFGNANIDELSEADRITVEVINQIRVRALNCRENPTDPNVCKFFAADQYSLPTVDIPARETLRYRLARTEICGVERFEEIEVFNQCRNPVNGLETTETRDFYWYLCDEINGYSAMNPRGGDTQADSREKLNRACNDIQGNSAQQWAGLDSRWSVSRFFWAGNDGSTCIEPYQGSAMYRTRCAAQLIRQEPIFGPARECGVTLRLDYDQPIFKECRHESHGLEQQ